MSHHAMTQHAMGGNTPQHDAQQQCDCDTPQLCTMPQHVPQHNTQQHHDHNHNMLGSITPQHDAQQQCNHNTLGSSAPQYDMQY